MSQRQIDYTARKSAENIKAAESTIGQRREAYNRDCMALELVQAARRLRPGEASQCTWLGLYGKRTPYRAKMTKEGHVVLV